MSKCLNCGCRVEKIKYAAERETQNSRGKDVRLPVYRHEVPHKKDCSCPMPNMTEDEVG